MTGRLVGSSLDNMDDLITRSLAEVKREAVPIDEPIAMALVLEELRVAATMSAALRGIVLAIEQGAAGLTARGDRSLVGSILQNLVQNACKFTPTAGHVVVAVRSTSDRILVDVADSCGGLPPGATEDLFRPYTQRGADRSGLGLGLAISRKGAMAIGGELSVRDRPGLGCTFTLALRRAPDTFVA